jgi:3-methyladenine DNA glycosylase Tag
MEVITMESQAFKDLTAKINTIAKFVTAMQSKAEEEPEDGWVDSYEVCTFLKISDKTLQRLRTAGAITFSRIRGKNFYRISEIQRLMQENVIRRSDEHLQDLIKNNRLHVEQRRNIKTDK